MPPFVLRTFPPRAGETLSVWGGLAVWAFMTTLLVGCSDGDQTPRVSETEIMRPPHREIVWPTATPTPTMVPATVAVAPTPAVQPTAREVAASTPMVVVASTPTPTPSPTMTLGATLVPTDTPVASSTPTATGTATSISRVRATATSTSSVTPSPSPTKTPAPTETPYPSPTPNPLDEIRFVHNDDCLEGISRELLPTLELVIAHGDASQVLVVEVADEARERQQGLMCRQIVPYGTGMLFVFETERSLSFWMFNTYAPLDIVYLDESRNVVRAVRMEPCPRPEGADHVAWRSTCTAASGGYGSGGAALYALELPAGWLASVGLELENLEGVEVSW